MYSRQPGASETEFKVFFFELSKNLVKKGEKDWNHVQGEEPRLLQNPGSSASSRRKLVHAEVPAGGNLLVG